MHDELRKNLESALAKFLAGYQQRYRRPVFISNAAADFDRHVIEHCRRHESVIDEERIPLRFSRTMPAATLSVFLKLIERYGVSRYFGLTGAEPTAIHLVGACPGITAVRVAHTSFFCNIPRTERELLAFVAFIDASRDSAANAHFRGQLLASQQYMLTIHPRLRTEGIP